MMLLIQAIRQTSTENARRRAWETVSGGTSLVPFARVQGFSKNAREKVGAPHAACEHANLPLKLDSREITIAPWWHVGSTHIVR